MLVRIPLEYYIYGPLALAMICRRGVAMWRLRSQPILIKSMARCLTTLNISRTNVDVPSTRSSGILSVVIFILKAGFEIYSFEITTISPRKQYNILRRIMKQRTPTSTQYVSPREINAYICLWTKPLSELLQVNCWLNAWELTMS